MNAQLKTCSTTAYRSPYFSADSLEQALEEPLADEYAKLHLHGVSVTGRPATEYRRTRHAALATDLLSVRKPWSELGHGLHALFVGDWPMARAATSTRDNFVGQQDEKVARDAVQHLATAWGNLVQEKSSVSAFEPEIDVHVRIPPKKTVSVTAVVVKRSKAQPNPILDL